MNSTSHTFAFTAYQRGMQRSTARHLIGGILGGIYAALLIQSYIVLSELWGYIGFWYRDTATSITLGSILAAALLVAALPTTNWSTVGFIKWMLCFMLFIPALVIPPQQGVLPDDQMILMAALIFISALALILFLPEARPLPVINIDQRTLEMIVVGAWLVSVIMILVVFQGALNVVGLDQVYVQRFSVISLATGAIAYVLGFFSGAINPFLLIVGIKEKRLPLVGMAVAGQILAYATVAAKVSIASLILSVIVYLLFNRDHIRWMRVYLGILAIAVAGPIVTRIQTTDLESPISTISDLIYLRILTLPGVAVGIYADFFSTSPLTYLSHSMIGRPFTEYPYGSLSIGQVIGYYVRPITEGKVNNFNANFIAADGITSFGLIGIPFIMAVSMLVFWLISKLVGPSERALTCAVLTPFMASLADASIFTALLTGGGGIAILLLYLRRSSRAIQPNWPPAFSQRQ